MVADHPVLHLPSDRLLNGKIFYGLTSAKNVIEQMRKRHNQRRKTDAAKTFGPPLGSECKSTPLTSQL